MEMEPGLVNVLAHERSLMLEISDQLPFQSLVTNSEAVTLSYLWHLTIPFSVVTWFNI